MNFPVELKSWSWAGHEGEKMLVQVYTRCQLVKIELKGKVPGNCEVHRQSREDRVKGQCEGFTGSII
jgi:hypothetical protein